MRSERPEDALARLAPLLAEQPPPGRAHELAGAAHQSLYQAEVRKLLKKAGALEVGEVTMAQGSKESRFVAWTFLNHAQRELWRRDVERLQRGIESASDGG